MKQRPSRKLVENRKASLNCAKNGASDEGLGNHREINSIAIVPKEEETRGAFRYGAVVATLVGVCALFVSGYTAYVQRQQVRAAVWPILEFESSNTPDIHFTLSNKGVGPAIIRHVTVTVDGKPVKFPGFFRPEIPPVILHDGSKSRHLVWQKFKPACPVDTKHFVEPWKDPGRCPRCGNFMEKNGLPFRLWD